MVFHRLACSALLVLALGVAPRAQAAESKGVAWGGWDSGLREASATKRPVLVDVYTDWCGWCRRMERDVYARSDVRDYLARRFVTVKLDAESNGAAQYEGEATTSRALAN